MDHDDDDDVPTNIGSTVFKAEDSTLLEYGFQGQLREYQRAAVEWITRKDSKGHGCILADEMGLGKTIVTIASILHLLRSSNKQRRFLIIAPLSLINNWKEEFGVFAPGVSVFSMVGDREERMKRIDEMISSSPDVIITSYEIYTLMLADYDFDAICNGLIIDEAHRLKNSKSNIHKNIDAFKCSFKLLLTGTPVQNNLTELFSLLHICCPMTFNESYMPRFLYSFDNLTAKEEVYKLIADFLLRRTKSQVLKDLPLKMEVAIYHGLTALQKKLYRAILSKNADALLDNGVRANTGGLMNVLMQLRKCILHPYMFPGVEPEPFHNGEHLVTNSGKLQVLDILIKYLLDHNHKALIFSKFTTMLDIVQDYMTIRDYTYERLDGSIRGDERHVAVNSFNRNSEVRFFLLSTLAGGTGLNLTAADTVVFLDMDFNPQNDLQALARCDRIGQTRPVKIFRLICQGTVDEVILTRQKCKIQSANVILENETFSGDVKTDKLDSAELRRMIKHGAERVLIQNADKDDDIDLDKIKTGIGASGEGRWLETEILANSVDPQPVSSDIYEFDGVVYRVKVSKAVDDALALNAQTPIVGKLPRASAQPKPHNDRPDSPVYMPQTKKTKIAAVSSLLPRVLPSVHARVQFEEEEFDIKHVTGDVTNPRLHSCAYDVVSVLCVDESGYWPRSSRLFQSFELVFPRVPGKYEKLASRTGRLRCGDVHLFSSPGKLSHMALFVAVERDSATNVTKLSDKLDVCLCSLQSHYAGKPLTSVHFPRLGFISSATDWYSVERLIRKRLCSDMEVYIHYVPRMIPGSSLKLSRLPCLFDGYRVYFQDFANEDEKIQMTKLVIIFGCSSVTDNRSECNVVISGNQAFTCTDLVDFGANSWKVKVPASWISKCIDRSSWISPC